MESKLNEHAYMTGFPRVNFVTLWVGLKPLSALDFFYVSLPPTRIKR